MRQIAKAELQSPARVLRLEQGAPSETLDVSSYESVWCVLVGAQGPIVVTYWDISADESVLTEDFLVGCDALGGRYDWPLRPASLTVAICTRNRADGLRDTLVSLAAQTDQDFDILVIDNAPTDTATRDLLSDLALPRCRYVVEPIPGLSNARNRALGETDTDLVAWLDDDELADSSWVSMLRLGFGHPSQPMAVGGLMFPAELETQAQLYFEQYGGFNKGRGLEPEVLEAGTPTVRDPLLPLPNFGAGGNMAFRTAALKPLAFDPYLGAGTKTHGGEETQVLSRLLLNGDVVLHWPAAMTWHYHRRTMPELEKQFYGYAAGLTAYFISMLRTSPLNAIKVAALVPVGLVSMRENRVGGERNPDLPTSFPTTLVAANRRGLLAGAFLYVQQVFRVFAARARGGRRVG